MMKNVTPDTLSPEAIVDWFANAGLGVEIVDRCPDTACRHCRPGIERAA